MYIYIHIHTHTLFFSYLLTDLVLFQDPKTLYHNESPTDLDGSSAVVATDYTKRPHVFRLKLANGGEYLYQCKDDVSDTLLVLQMFL